MNNIEIQHASGEVERRKLSKTEPLSIGRHNSNDIQIDEDEVAVMHCRICWNKAVFEVTAAGPGGVDVNGTMVNHASLLPGDVIRIGSVDITLFENDAQKQKQELHTDPLKSPATQTETQQAGKEKEEDIPLRPSSSADLPVWHRSPITDFHGETNHQDQQQPKSSQKPNELDGKKIKHWREKLKETDKKRRQKTKSEDWELVADDDDDEEQDSENANRKRTLPKAGQAKQTTSGSLKETLGELKSRLKSKPVRPGERDIARSPMVMTTFGGVLILALFAATFWFMISRDTVQRRYDAAVKEMEEGRYTQAITLFQEFLTQYPRHSFSEPARLQLGRARVEKEIVGSTPAWKRGLDALDDFVRKHRDFPSFNEQHAAICDYAEKIALGSAHQAEENTKRQPLEWSNSATSILVQFSPPKQPPKEAQEKIETAVATAEAAILMQETYQAAIDQIDRSIQNKDTITALNARRHLLDRYPHLVDNPGVVRRLQDTLETEKSLVTLDKSDQAAFTEDHPRPLPLPLSLTHHTRTQSSEPSDGRIVFAVAKDCCYGIDVITGDPLWRRVIGLDSPFFPVEVTTKVQGLLLFDVNHSELILLQQKTGRLIWRLPLGENISGAPLFHQGQAYLPTLGKHLLKVDLETGQLTAKLTFPQKLLAPPVLLSDQEHLVVAADQAVLYTVSIRPLECKFVSYLGHTPGSIDAPLIGMGRLLLMAENDRVENCLLRVIDASDPHASLKQIAQQRIEGHVRDTPVIRGRQLFVPADSERIYVFTVSDDLEQPQLTSVASYQVKSPYNGPIFLSVGPDGQLWMTGSSLRKFRLTTESIQLDPNSFVAGISSQPLQAMGDSLFPGRQFPYATAIAFSRTNRDEMTSPWKTILGSSLLACETAGENTSAVCLNESGNLFVVNDAHLENDRFLLRADVDLKLPDSLEQPLHVSRLHDGRLAIRCGQPKPHLWLIDTKGSEEKNIELKQPLEANPILLSQGIVLPLPGRLKLISTNTDSPKIEDFISPLERQQTSRWKQLALLDQNQLIVLDSEQRLRRIQYRTEPVPHLAEVSSLELPHPVDVRFVVSNGKIILADAGRRLMLINASNLEILADTELKEPATNDVWLIDNKIYLETGRKHLHCFQLGENIQQQWSLPLENGHLAGRPLQIESDLILAAQNGSVLSLNIDNGKVINRLELEQPINLGPRRIGKQIVVPSIDGSLHRIETVLGEKK